MKYRLVNFYNALAARNFFNWIPDALFLKIQFFLALHKILDIKNPKTYNDKLQWLKLYDRQAKYTMMVDKYLVRKYIAEKIGEEYLIPLIGGPWKSFDEIDFKLLPEQFVLKCNHNSGGLVICKNKSTLNINDARKKINKGMKRNFYWANREWPYKNVEPCIIAEKYMVDESGYELKDYKFFCFNGEPKIMYIASGRYVDTKVDFFDMDFNHLPFINGHPCAEKTPDKPNCFNEMKKIAKILAKGIKHIRVDFYVINEHVYFGELTFFPSSGMSPFEPIEWDYKLGEWIKL